MLNIIKYLSFFTRFSRYGIWHRKRCVYAARVCVTHAQVLRVYGGTDALLYIPTIFEGPDVRDVVLNVILEVDRDIV